MIDTHCHLTDPRLAEQLDQVLARAAAAGVTRMVTIGTGIDDDIACIELCRAIPNVRCAIGVHPNYAGEAEIEDVPRLRQLQFDSSVVALGEMGLDYFHKHSPRDRQRQVFEFQLDLAAELNRPIVIHSREAIEDTLAMMRGFPMLRAVFHCFTGTPDEASRILEAGYLLGFTGAVTFKKADDLRKVAASAPMDRILVETDAPYLTPEPMRKQKTNEPALVVHVAQVVADVKGVTLEEIGRTTT
ncbi:MAG TPA: TatD family hydrolase, partial [Tepidisphaeraceae bacterium]|nr:TatD family hydrolase [Tepidisphaeraceae bacterium]